MPEGVDGDDGTVSWSFLDMEQRVAELFAVGVQKVNGACREIVSAASIRAAEPRHTTSPTGRSRTFLADELPSHFMLELL